MDNIYFFKKGSMQMGPYPLEKMRALARQGQVGRSYLVSTDGGASWDTGSSFPEIFAPDPAPAGPDPVTPAVGGGGGGPPTDPEWYYCSSDGEQKGPVPESQLRHLIGVGAVGATDSIWTAVLGDKWVNAGEVPKFASLFSSPAPMPGGNASGLGSISINTQGTSNPGVGGAHSVFCRECGCPINRRAVVCPQCGVPTEQAPQQRRGPSDSKNKTTAALLAFFLGGLGAHHFYLGNVALGLIYLLFCWTFIPAIVSFIEAIVFLSMSGAAFDAKYNH
jgi:TM2 domain-containing membrane protein YozV